MSFSRFEIFMDSDNEIHFRLRAGEKGGIVLTSIEGFDGKVACHEAIEEVRKASKSYLSYRNNNLQEGYRFTLVLADGTMLAVSENYSNSNERKQAMELVKAEAPTAAITDLAPKVK